MTETSLAPETRIRIIARALYLLDAFNADIRQQITAGQLRITSQMQSAFRKNAEEEGRLRRRLARLKAELSEAESSRKEHRDSLHRALQDAISDHMTGFTVTFDENTPPGANTIRLAPQDERIIRTDIFAPDLEQLSQAIENLTHFAFGLSLTIDDQTYFFVISPSTPDPNINENLAHTSYDLMLSLP